MKPYQVLVVDNADTGIALANSLQADGEYLVTHAASQEAALRILAEPGGNISAVIASTQLPDADGQAFCRRLRSLDVAIPIILLGNAADEPDLVSGFAGGASDYVTKPFRAGELAARLRAALRGYWNSRDAELLVGHYVFKPSAKTLSAPGRRRPIRLTDKETRLLRFLHDADGKLVQRQMLMAQVWGQTADQDTHTVESHVYRLRQKIEPNPSLPQILLTAPGGYRLAL